MSRKLLLFFILGTLLFQGCARVLLPYEECVECDVGKGEGYCGSVSDVYNHLNKKGK